MRIAFTNNPIDKLSCWASNKYEEITQLLWNHSHQKVTCIICGQVLDPKKDKYSPVQCGWHRLSRVNKSYQICHQCIWHRDFKPFIKEIDEREEALWNKEK